VSGVGDSTVFAIPAAQPATAVFCQSRLLWETALAPRASPRSRPEPAPTRNNRPLGQRPPSGKNTDRNPARTSRTPPGLKPASASPKVQCEQDRDNPAPVTIEAGIFSSPVSQSGPHRSYKKIRNQSLMPDTQPPDPSDPHRRQLPPVKRTFGYFCCNRQKSLARKRAARGETAFEFEVEVGFDLIAARTRPRCPNHHAA